MQNDMTAAVEAERRRLAALLENDIINMLNLLLSQASVYEQTMGANPQASMAVSVMAGLIRQTLQKARDLQTNLNPTILEALGLEPALEALASQQNRTYGVHFTLKLERLRQRLPLTIEFAIFRAAQTVLERAVSQVHASRIGLRLMRQDNQVIFEYDDNGVGRAGLDVLNTLAERIHESGGKVKADLLPHGELQMTITFLIAPIVDLTVRELEIIEHLAEGLSNKEIAAALNVSARTVNFHLDNMYSKLGVNTRTEAVMAALKQGLIQKPS